MKDMISQISNNNNNISPEKLADTLRSKFMNISPNMNSGVSTTPMQTPMQGMSMPDITEKTSSIQPESSMFSGWVLFKIVLAVTIIGALFFNIYTYVSHGKDAISYYFGEETTTMSEVKNEIVLENDVAESGEEETALDMAAERQAKKQEKSMTDLESVMEKKNTQKDDDAELEKAMVDEIEKKNKNYSANNVSINATSKAGYCFVGADRNVRTCVKVGEDDVCMSGDIYPTMDICVNPNLKD